TQLPTTVSVGPYSFTIWRLGTCSRQKLTTDSFSASPPTTNRRAPTPAAFAPNRLRNPSRCPGVTFTSVSSAPPPSISASASSCLSSGNNLTTPPAISGTYKLVIVASNDSDVLI